MYEGELSILFGDTNTGKSILANDIAFFVSGGVGIWNDWVSPQVPSLYIDMEMTNEQFASRYRGAVNYIPDTYSRATVDTLLAEPDEVVAAIKHHIISSQKGRNAPKFIIIDNITNGFGSIYSPIRMKNFIIEMKELKQKYGLTILLIAHCPKRKKKKPITEDDLGGTKMILNFVDSAFAIAQSMKWKSARYIKQIKCRHGKKLSQVLHVQLDDVNIIGFTRFCYTDYTDEEDQFCVYTPTRHLKLSPQKEAKLLELYKNDYGSSVDEIARKLKVDSMVVIDYIIANFA
ncbi:MAG: AAA family ATPase [Bacteroidales bacterium]|nr:AAA family ATPase [Bacteroidales bacterium]